MTGDNRIEKIYELFEVTDEMRYLADEMSKSISSEYESCVLADERKLEAVLRENGWRKVSEVIDEIADFIWQDGEKWNISIGKRCYDKQEFIAELKKKYTEDCDG